MPITTDSPIPWTLILCLIVAGFAVFMMSDFMLRVPVSSEGFGGVARGSGQPDCLRTLPESSQLLDVFTSVLSLPSSLSDVIMDPKDDYKELELLLSKMAALKKDLLSPSGIIEATRYQTFDTNHDRIAVAELTGQCLSKNIPSRDLDIIFATWRDRGENLVRRLSTAASLSEKDTSKAESLFKKCWTDVYDISKSQCIKSDYQQQHGSGIGGDVGSYEPVKLSNIRTYDYNYAGQSASGWNGAV